MSRVLAFAAGSLMMAGCGHPTGTVSLTPGSAQTPQCQSPVTWSSQQSHEDLGEGIRLDPPPPNVSPKYTYLQTFSSAPKKTGCGTGVPDMRLATFSDDLYGTTQSDGTETHPYQNVLTWVVIWRNQACPVFGPGPAPVSISTVQPSGSPSAWITPTHPLTFICDHFDFFDANADNVMLGYERFPENGSPLDPAG
jgi:hypothetical protein